jgi:hypothetical protein
MRTIEVYEDETGRVFKQEKDSMKEEEETKEDLTRS